MDLLILIAVTALTAAFSTPLVIIRYGADGALHTMATLLGCIVFPFCASVAAGWLTGLVN